MTYEGLRSNTMGFRGEVIFTLCFVLFQKKNHSTKLYSNLCIFITGASLADRFATGIRPSIFLTQCKLNIHFLNKCFLFMLLTIVNDTRIFGLSSINLIMQSNAKPTSTMQSFQMVIFRSII
jgi:hypothetical protein